MGDRIVVKLGTNTLCDADGLPDLDLMAAIAQQVHRLRSDGHQVLLVSSGAIGFGRSILKLPELPLDVPMRQACAAVGQHHLMKAWDTALGRHKIPVAQVLVTSNTFQMRRRYVDLHNCIEALLRVGAVPIFNENDTISTEEIDAMFTDNDRLGALVAARVQADVYVMLSDVAGLYDRAPSEEGATLIRRVPRVDDVMALGGPAGKRGRGGMASKLESARELTQAGVEVAIGYGREPNILLSLTDWPGTWFDAVGRRDGMERWLLAARPVGTIRIDAGAAAALASGKHLLPAGITAVEGAFPVESVVAIVGPDGPVAHALSLLSSGDLNQCIGMQSDAARGALGIEGGVNVTRKGRIALA